MTDVLVSQTTNELIALDLPKAPPVIRATAVPTRRPRPPAIALLVLGVLLALGPIVGGLFSKVASGKQMIDQFEPHMEADARARYATDLQTLRRAAAAVDAIYAEQNIAAGRFPGLDVYRREASAIDQRATTLLERVNRAEPDYRRVANIGGFDRIPFLVVLYGIALIYGAVVLLAAGRVRARIAAAAVLGASLALAVYPFVSDLNRGMQAGERMLDRFDPIMTRTEVRQLQSDFVVLVTATGQLDTAFRAVPQTGQPATDVAALINGWPGISSDLAALVGTVNDNIGNFNALEDLDGTVGLDVFPRLLIGLAIVGGLPAVAAAPRRRKEP